MDEKKIRETLRELRFRLRLSQQEFAARVSKSYSSIQRYEGKEAPPALELAAFWELAEQEGHRDLAEVLFDALVTAIPARLKERLSGNAGSTHGGSVTGEQHTRKIGRDKPLAKGENNIVTELSGDESINPDILAWAKVLINVLSSGHSVSISAIVRNLYAFQLLTLADKEHADNGPGVGVPSFEQIKQENIAIVSKRIRSLRKGHPSRGEKAAG